MRIVSIVFIEPVESPILGRGGGFITNMRSTDGPLKVRPMGPGIIIEQEGNASSTVVPWANVKFARVVLEADDGKAAKR